MPVFVLLLFGLLDVGRAVYAYTTIANAARDGARVAAVNQLDYTAGTSCNENMPIENVTSPAWSARPCAAAAAVSLGVLPTDVTIEYAPPAGTTLTCSPTLHVGCLATVTVAYTWTALTPVIGRFIGPITMTSTSQMPIQNVFP